MYGLTPVQKSVMDFIRSYTSENGYSPSYTDICEGTGLSSRSGAHRIVHALVERGYIRLIPHKHRTIEMV